MSAGSLLVGLVLLAALGGAVVYPWRRPPRRRATQVSADPRQEYQALVIAIRDLDFDYRAGVITDADYRPLRDDLAAEAVSSMQAMDRGGSDPTAWDMQLGLTCPACGSAAEAEDRFCATCGQGLVQAVSSAYRGEVTTT